MFLKTYGNEATLCSLAGGVSKNTFHKWSWIMIYAISYLEPYVVSKDNNNLNFFTFFLHFYIYFHFNAQIVWEDRKNVELFNDCLISVDGTDFKINLPKKGSMKTWYSHKFKYPALRYEIGLCILTG